MALSSNFGNMFSVAAASFVLPFLPMLPTQILLNNLLYDTSQLGISFDNADHSELERPRKLSMHFIRRFMFIFGPLSSVFDLLTFVVLYYLLHLSESAFQTGWFIESLATQTLVIFIIRTKRLPFIQSRPSRYIIISAMGIVIIGVYLAFSNLGRFFGFSPISIQASLSIFLIVFFYLISVEIVKRWFYRQAATIKLE